MEKQRWRVATLGVSAHDERVLKSMLQLVAGRTIAAWEFAEDTDADVVLCEPTSALAAMTARRAAERNGPLCVALARSGQPTDPLPRAVHVPLRANELVALFDDVSSRPRTSPREARAHEARRGADENLAIALRDLTMRERDGDRVFRLAARAGALYVAFPEQTFVSEHDAALDRFAACGGPIEIEIVYGADATAIRSDLRRRPLDALLWRCGLVWPSGSAVIPLSATSRVRLRRWPDFGVVPPESPHLALAAALGARPSTLDELTARTRLPVDEVQRFANACAMCGLLEIIAAATAQPRVERRGWAHVVRSLRSALGLAS